MSASSKKAEERTFEAGPWRISVRKSHILRSVCERGRDQGCEEEEEPCTVCRYGLVT